MNILIFGGTTEGREISHLLAERGAQVLVCVATEYGREEQGEAPGITVLTGRKDRTAILSLLEGADLCIDATHPYAENISRTLRDACDAAACLCGVCCVGRALQTGSRWRTRLPPPLCWRRSGATSC